jgi:predicted metalloprotease with PDZ domain
MKQILIILLATSLFCPLMAQDQVDIRIRDSYRDESGNIQSREKSFSGQFTEEEIEEKLKSEDVPEGMTLLKRSMEIQRTDKNGNSYLEKNYYQPGNNNNLNINPKSFDELPSKILGDEESMNQLKEMVDRLQEQFNLQEWISPEGGMLFQFDGNDMMPGGGFWGNNSSKAYLGISVARNIGDGVIISRVNPESPAAKSGLQEGDIIWKVDDEVVTSTQGFLSKIRSKQPGDAVKIEFTREGSTQIQYIELETNPQSNQKPFIQDFEFNFNPDGGQNGRIQWPFSKEKKNKSLLGVSVQELKNFDGLKVTQVDAGSPAEQAGIQVDDVIVRLDKKKVESPAHLKSLLEDKSGESVRIELKRNGKKKKVNVQLLSKHS